MPPAEDATGLASRREFGAALLHLVFPVPCHTCGLPLDRNRRGPLCGRCWQLMERSPLEGCFRCGRPLVGAGADRPLCGRCRTRPDAFLLARAPFVYRDGGTVRTAVLLAKHAGQMGLLRALAEALAAEAPRHLSLGEWDAVIPVPLHWRRRWHRGFNQAEILADAVGRRHGLPVVRRTLIRGRPTPPQQGDPEARQRNVRDAFRVRRPDRIAGRRLLLVDDVFTTGATANACAGVLGAAGAIAVGVLTLARVA
jgi:ComF family protein